MNKENGYKKVNYCMPIILAVNELTQLTRMVDKQEQCFAKIEDERCFR